MIIRSNQYTHYTSHLSVDHTLDWSQNCNYVEYHGYKYTGKITTV